MYVLKASGEREEFDARKVRRTCIKAGAPEDLAEKIAAEVGKQVYDGISTHEILKITLRLLGRQPGAATRYSLKRAIMALGPAGFQFEKYMAEVLQNYGYATKVGQIIRGKCINHEVDIAAEKEGKKYMIECKYHNMPGIHTDVKVAMYTHARFLDLGNNFDYGWITCNTKLTQDAIKFADCVGLKVTCWGYPKKESLERLIEDKELYPVTVLQSLKSFTRERLFQAGLMLTKDLVETDIEKLRQRTGLQKGVLEKIVAEAKQVKYVE